MVLIKKIVRIIRNPSKIVYHMGSKGMLRWVPDNLYLKLIFKARMGKKLNLTNPKTFNEKLQWLKVYSREPLLTNLVDKYEVRKHIASIIGEQYLIPLLGVWDEFEDIDFTKLPDKFVLKCTHDSGGVVICRDIDKFDIEKARKIINKSLQRNYYYPGREWPYKNIKPRIICEELIGISSKNLPSDYKFHCFNGKAENVMVCTERDSGNPKFYFFDKTWKLQRYNVSGLKAPEDFSLEKPKKIDEMFEIAEILALKFPFVRVDLYFEDKKIYFGELTFYPQSGFDTNLLKNTDELFGNKILI